MSNTYACGKRATKEYTAATCVLEQGHAGVHSWDKRTAGNARGTKQRVHRGLSKADTKLLSVRLTNDVWEQLCAVAEHEHRSATGQAAWLIKQAMMAGQQRYEIKKRGSR